MERLKQRREERRAILPSSSWPENAPSIIRITWFQVVLVVQVASKSLSLMHSKKSRNLPWRRNSRYEYQYPAPQSYLGQRVHLSRKHENSPNKFYALATRTLLPHSKTYIHIPGDREVGANTRDTWHLPLTSIHYFHRNTHKPQSQTQIVATYFSK